MSRIVGVHTPSEMKNYVINGSLDFWQEKEGDITTVNTATTTSQYSADMFLIASFGPTVKNYSYGRNTDVPTAAQSGFVAPYSYNWTTLTAIPSFAAADFVDIFQYRMEGLDYAKIHGKIVTVGFWMKASVVGTYSVSLTNATETRSYVTTVTQNVANAWEFKSVTVQLEIPTANYSFGNTNGLTVRLGSVAGSTNSTTNLNQWQAGAYYAASTAVNHMATVNATVKFTMLSIVEGTQGYGTTGFQRSSTTEALENVAVCRYYRRLAHVPVTVQTTNTFTMYLSFEIPMRAAPSITTVRGTSMNIQGTAGFNQSAVPGFSIANTVEGLLVTITGYTVALSQGVALLAAVPVNNNTLIAADARI